MTMAQFYRWYLSGSGLAVLYAACVTAAKGRTAVKWGMTLDQTETWTYLVLGWMCLMLFLWQFREDWQ